MNDIQLIVSIRELTTEDIYTIYVIFRDQPRLLDEFKAFVPAKVSIEPAEDFEQTSLVRTVEDGKAAWIATLGLNAKEFPPSDGLVDRRILNCLSSVLVNRERSEAVWNLQGQDAQRTVDLMQKV